MNLQEIDGVPGAFLGRPKIHEDSRGFFLEVLREDVISVSFVQGNHSHSRAGVLRGLHYHKKQADAWYLMNGEAQAILADLRIRAKKPKVVSVDLSEKDRRILYIPPGVAHGFLAITDVDLIYWVTNYYDSTDEFGMAWNDPIVSAPWRIEEPVLSDRDKQNPKLDWDSIDLSS